MLGCSSASSHCHVIYPDSLDLAELIKETLGCSPPDGTAGRWRTSPDTRAKPSHAHNGPLTLQGASVGAMKPQVAAVDPTHPGYDGAGVGIMRPSQGVGHDTMNPLPHLNYSSPQSACQLPEQGSAGV